MFDMNTSINYIYTHQTFNKFNRYLPEGGQKSVYKDVRMDLELPLSCPCQSLFNHHCHLIHYIELSKPVHTFPASLPTHPPPSTPQILKTKTVLNVMKY